MLVTLDLKTLGSCDVCANAPNSGHLANMQISTKLKAGSHSVFSFSWDVSKIRMYFIRWGDVKGLLDSQVYFCTLNKKPF